MYRKKVHKDNIYEVTTKEEYEAMHTPPQEFFEDYVKRFMKSWCRKTVSQKP